MASFSITTRGRARKNGQHTVYIMLSHKSVSAYIRTGLYVSDDGIESLYTKEGKEVRRVVNARVVNRCSRLIEEYTDRLYEMDFEEMTAQQIVDELRGKQGDVSFNHFVIKLMGEKSRGGKETTAAGYRLMLRSLQRYLGRDDISFHNLKRSTVEGWIESLQERKRSANLYPTLLKAVITKAMRKFNDYERNVMLIKYNPFDNIDIPKYRARRHKAVDVETVRRLLSVEVEGRRATMARDVAKIIFCLAGINCADLYDIEKDAYSEETHRLSYNRKKTRDRTVSESYMEITVPDEIRGLLATYRGQNRLFDFSERYAESGEFVRNVNKGLKQVCRFADVSHATTYTFRHTWATVAQNSCGASMEDVAFCLCHESAHKVTEGYVMKDYSRVDVINRRVIDFVLHL
jgi:site-specific recombinase XerD